MKQKRFTNERNLLSDSEIMSLAYDCNALPECITDESLKRFARAIEDLTLGVEMENNELLDLLVEGVPIEIRVDNEWVDYNIVNIYRALKTEKYGYVWRVKETS